MITLKADVSLPSVLGQVNETAEIRDAGGKLLGFFVPAGQEEAVLYREAASHFDAEEMKRRKQSGAKGYSTREVLEHLRSLETA